ncbi:restriction endonuclease subunit S [Staphylococcus epidermidis]|jgi:type I restriction enzyme S subunit|uniref:Type I restriction-modification system specificity subunit S n=3 Tax=Staphylococcus epidermidis TaxID=1282 RepID=A0A6B9V1D8_STAEP|nr:restriction endonuclease subunit S [Staphylococcus epidermidis]EJE22897.1 hypothetical protein HMPREF9976_07396 [Staphylococcus epidermidis NIHLM003]MBM5939331.1 restriction endonuclease subunit S [Staphylococcus epidermidis]MBM5943945.1 restriction endonuclease subunit S [Staphylococcus epidermidis]MBM5952815.1 restriction endonuclease subunit S [Staphylococcus epidermidis]MBM6023973.1 restriction endonuclease subunit S [Staphylococcus epidermidis]
MNENKLTPSIRFKNNDGESYPEWDFVKVKEIASINTGNKDTKDAVENGQYDFYVRSPIVHKIDSFSYDGEAILTVGDGVGVGKVFHYVNGKFDFHQRVYKISDFKDYYGLLFYYYFQKNFLKEAQKYNAKTSVDSVRKSMIADMYVPKIEMSEQIKIGNFFSKLDRQIELEEEKLELLEQQKRGYMQKIFSQELIFKDENGNSYPKWKSKKIKELFNVIDGDRGKNYPSEKDFYDKGHTLFLDTGNVTKNGFLFNRNRFIDKEKDDMLRKGKLELNDFVITSRGTLGNIGFYGQNIHHKYPNIRINSAMLILRPLNNKFNNQYLYFLLKNDAIDTFMKHYRVGSAQPHITKKDFGNMKISVIIDINEQRKIAKFLTIIDKLVINQSTKVELLKQRKQGLLQKMFI